MLDIADGLLAALRAGEWVALAKVIATRGPVPRSTGTCMAIRRTGGHLGTVGGGCGEAEVIRAGLGALDTGGPVRVEVDLTEAVTGESEAACGGTMDVLIVPCGPRFLPVLEAVVEAATRRTRLAMLTCLDPAAALGAMVVVAGGRLAWAGLEEGVARRLAEALTAPDGESGDETRRRTVNLDGETWTALVEGIQPRPALLICGGGHIALPLSQMGKMLDLGVVVIDDRPSYASVARFPWADQVVCAPFAQALRDYPVDGDTYAVIVTRGHSHDYECLRHLLGRGAGYLGMIGSRRRVAGVLRLLRDDGFSAEVIANLHSPIGLDIGAQTPAEIAISILAEIVQARRGGTGRSLKLT